MIVVCSNCGKKNRISRDTRVGGTYHCGACSSLLHPPWASSDQNPLEPHGQRLNVLWRGRQLGICLLFSAVVLAAFFGGRYSGFHQTSYPTVSNTAKVTAPPLQSRVNSAEAQTNNGEGKQVNSAATKELAVAAASSFGPHSGQPVKSARQSKRNRPSSDQLRTPVSLANGTEVANTLEGQGMGELTVSNGGNTDALVKLVSTSDRRLKRITYVRAGSEITVSGIASGSYYLRFTTGTDWDNGHRRFRRDRANSQFDNQLEFVEDSSLTGTRYSQFSVTLHPVMYGNARTHGITDAEFDAD